MNKKEIKERIARGRAFMARCRAVEGNKYKSARLHEEIQEQMREVKENMPPKSEARYAKNSHAREIYGYTEKLGGKGASTRKFSKGNTPNIKFKIR